jgi:drug/metabolite transporter (DMT)-like permease
MAFIAASYNWYYSDKFMGSMLSVIAIALYVVIGLLIIAGIVLGIIGIKQRRPKKGMAIAGIIICSLMIVATFCQYGCLYIMPKISVMLSEADNQIYETLPR